MVSKALFTFVFVLMLSVIRLFQEKNMEIESATRDNLMVFIVAYSDIQFDSTDIKNISFLIEIYSENFNTEVSVILK